MFTSEIKQENKILSALVVLMLLTRFHHFGDINTLADATLAVFFGAGLYCKRLWVLPLLLVEAGLIDYVAIHFGGVSAWCVSPAYFFLIPTYAVMWQGGRLCSGWVDTGKAAIRTIPLVILTATSLAFLISNASFYLLSSRFESLNMVEYFLRVFKYYPSYTVTTVVYISVILAVHALIYYSVGRRASLGNSHK